MRYETGLNDEWSTKKWKQTTTRLQLISTLEDKDRCHIGR